MQTTPTLEVKLPVSNNSDELAVMEFYPKEKQHVVQINNEEFLIIGDDNGYSLGVNLKNGVVSTVSEKSLRVDTFVNSSVPNLLTFMEKYRAVMLTKTTEEKKLQLLTNLWKELKKIDPQALQSVDHTWWGEFLDDKLLMFGGDVEEIEAQAA